MCPLKKRHRIFQAFLTLIFRCRVKAVGGHKTVEPAQMRGALKLRDACEYLGGLSVPTMHRLIGRGLIRPNRSLRHLLFPISELDRFLREGMS
jgi:hypothetical protein